MEQQPEIQHTEQHTEQQPVVHVQQQPEIQEITAKEKPKEKDPKRVAAGKRLAAISQKAKEEKMRKLLEQEEIVSWKQCVILSMGIGVLGFAAYKYFWQKKEEVVVYSPKKVHHEMEKEEPPPKRKQRGKPISMFDD